MSDPRDPKREPATGTGTDDAGIEQSLEEAALDRARAYVAELEAEAALLDEPAGAPAEAAVEPTREESDAQALEEFQRLRDRSAKKTL